MAYVSPEDMCRCALGVDFKPDCSNETSHRKAAIPFAVVKCLIDTKHGFLPNGRILTYKGRPVFATKTKLATMARSGIATSLGAAPLFAAYSTQPKPPTHIVTPPERKSSRLFKKSPGGIYVPPALRPGFMEAIRKKKDSVEQMHSARISFFERLVAAIPDDFDVTTTSLKDTLVQLKELENKLSEPDDWDMKLLKVSVGAVESVCCMLMKICSRSDLLRTKRKTVEEVAGMLLNLSGRDSIEADRKLLSALLTVNEGAGRVEAMAVSAYDLFFRTKELLTQRLGPHLARPAGRPPGC